MSKEKPHLNLVITGHVDHGKSTLMGHVLYLAGVIDDRTIRSLESEAEKLKDPSFKFAFVLDRLKEERERGLTIDLAFYKFDTKKYYFTIIDCPGHRDFVKNMITGTSQADAAILTVSAKKGEFEAGIGKGGQTVEHAVLGATLGVSQFLVAVNKMDDMTVNWSKDRYEEVKSNVDRIFKLIERELQTKLIVTYVPVSAWTGDNLMERSSNMPWYDGPVFFEALDVFVVPEKPIDKPLRIPVQDVYSITGVGTVPVGRVETGVLNEGDVVVFMPSNKQGEIKTLEMHHTRITKAEPGDNIGFNVKGLGKKDLRRGDVAGPLDSPPTVVKEFTGRIFVIYHPTAIAAGYTPVVHAHTAQVACTISELQSKIDRRTGQTIEANPSHLKSGDGAMIKLIPTRAMVIEKFSDFPPLGRFAVRDMGMTIAVGIVEDVAPKKMS
ncbi:MAG: translation elongation factor EF-1 subunit alpha [Candidatus Wukongarchaeota archaeon]|nr:translation elongation factor EF-1 subunit alpha [Candidatus Wukongarchaeota archaeon]